MNKQKKYGFWSGGWLLCLCLFSFSTSYHTEKAADIALRMVQKIGTVDRLKYDLKIAERFGSKMTNFQSSVKLNRKPRKLYLFTGGIEVLWVAGENDGEALVKPNSFPYFNLNLDPMGSLMREDQHHTIHEMGFDYLASIVKHIYDSQAKKLDAVFKLESSQEWCNGKWCYKIAIQAESEFKWVNYKVLKGEDVVTIARKMKVSEYMVLEKNSAEVSDYEDVKEGQIIQIPTLYARNVILYIDKQNYFPVALRIFDDKGLFEQYDYSNLQLNPVFAADEFTENFPSYGF